MRKQPNYSAAVRNANTVNFIGKNGVNVTGAANTTTGIYDITVTGKEVNYTVNNQTVTNGTNGEPANQSTVNNVNYVNGTGTTPNVTINNGTLNVAFDVNTTNGTVNPNGTVSVTNGDSFLNATEVANLVNNSSFNITTAKNNDQVKSEGHKDVQVKAGDTITYKAGKNLEINQDGANITYGLSENISLNNITANNITVGNTTITNGTISGLNSNLPDTYNKDVYNTEGKDVTKEQSLPTNLNVTNAATVGDILNSGWNLQENGAAKDFVKPYDTVNFNNGTATTAVIETDANGTVSNVTYNVNVDNATISVVDGKLVANTSNIIKGDNSTTNVTNGTVAVKTGDVNANTTTGKAESNVTNGTIATVTDVANTINNVFHTVNATNTDEAVTATNGTTQVKAGDTLEFVAGKNLVVNQTGGRIAFATAENVTFNHVNTTTLTVGNVSDPTAPTTNISSTDKGLDVGGDKITNVSTALNNITIPTTSDSNTGDNQNKFIDLTNATDPSAVVTVGDLKDYGWVVRADGNNYSAAVRNANTVNFIGKNGVNVTGAANATTGIYDITVTGKEVNYTVNNQTVTNGTNGEPANQSTVNNVNYVNGTGTTPNVTINNGTLNVAFDVNTTNGTVNPNGTVSVTNGDSFLNATEVANLVNNSSFNITTAKNNDQVTSGGHKDVQVKAGDTITYKAGKNLEISQDGANITYGLSENISLNNITANNITVGNTTITNGTISGLNSTLPPTYNKDEYNTENKDVTTSQDLPSGLNVTNAATVGDILNSGWNLQENGAAKDFVKPYDTVNFVNGTATTANITTDDDGKVSVVKYNVNVDNATISVVDGKLVANTSNIIKGDNSTTNVTNGTVAVKTGDVNANTTTGKAESNVTNGTIATVADVANTINNVFHTVNATNTDEAVTATNGTTQVKAGDTLEFVAGKNLVVNQTGGRIAFATAENVTFNHVNTTTLTVGNVSDPTAPTTNISSTDKGLDVGGDKITNVSTALNNITIPTTSDSNTGDNQNKFIDLTNATDPSAVVTVGDLKDYGWVVRADGNNYSAAVRNANTVNFIGKNGVNVTGKANATTGIYDITVTGKEVNYTVNNQTVTNGTNGEPANQSTVNNVNYVNGTGTTPNVTINNGTLNVAFDVNTTNGTVNPNGTVSVTNGDSFLNATEVANLVNNSSFNITTAKNNDQVTSGGHKDVQVKAGDTITYKAGKNLEINQDGANITYGLSENISLNNITANNITVGNTTITNGTISGLNSTLPPTYNKDEYNTNNSPVTKEQSLPTNLNVTNAATVGDILNSGWNLQENGAAKDFVKPYDTVNFNNGTATTAVIETDANGTVSNVTYNVNVDNATISVVDGKLVANTSNIIKGDNSTTNVTNGTVAVKTGDVNANTTTGKAESNVTNGTIATVTDVANTINNVFHTVNATNTDEAVTATNGTTQVKAGDTLEFVAGKNLVVNQTGGRIAFATAENVTFNHVNTTTLTVGNVSDPTAPTTNISSTDKGLDVGGDKITNVSTALNNITIPTTSDSNTGDNQNKFIDLTNATDPSAVVTVGDLKDYGWVVRADGNNYSAAVRNANTVNFIGENGVNVTGKANATTGIYDITVTGKEVNYTVNNQTVTNGTNGEPANQSTVNNVNYVNGTGTTPNVTINNGTLNVAFDVNTTNGTVNPNGTVSVTNGDSFLNATEVANLVNNSSFNITTAKNNDQVTSGGHKDVQVKAGDTITYKAGKNLEINQDGANITYGLSENISLNNITANNITVGNTTITNGTISGLNSNLPDTYNKDVYNTEGKDVTKEQSLPTNLNVTNAATVGDILNSGWNLQENGAAKDFVKPYDTVNFNNGTATTAVIETDANGTVSNVTYNVNVDNATISVVDGKLVANTSNIIKGDNSTTNVTNGTVAVKTGDVKANTTTGKAESNVTNGTIATVTDVANTINNVFHTLNTSKVETQITSKANATGAQVKAGDTVQFTAAKNLEIVQDGHNITYGLSENITVNNVNTTTLTIGNVSNTTAPKVDFNAETAKPATNNNASNAPEFALNITTNGKPTQITGVGSVLNLTDVATNPGDKDGARQPDVTKQLVNLTNLPEGTLNSAATVRDLVNMGWIVKATGNNYSNTVKNANEVNFVGAGGVTVEGSDSGDVRTITIKGKEVNYTVNNQTVTNTTSGEPANQSTVNNVNYVNGNGTTPNVTINNGTLNVGFDVNSTSTSTNENGTAKLDDPTQGASFVNASTLVNTLNNVSHNITASNANGGKDGVQTVADPNQSQTRVKAGDTVTYSAGKNLVVNQTTDGNGNHVVEYGLSSDINVTSITVGNTTITNGTISGLNNHFNNASSLTGGTNLNSSSAPTTISNNLTEAATVQDVLNSGWNLQENGKAKDFVAAYDTVNFNNGSGTVVNITSDGNKSDITVNVKVDGSSVTIDKNGNLTANSTNIANAATGNVSANATTGKAEFDSSNGTKPLATVDDVANTVNNVYHTVNTSSNDNQVVSGADAAGTKVRAGDTLTYVAGKNLEINQTGSTITYGLSKDITVSNVNTTTLTVGNVSNPTAPKVDFNADNATPATNNPTQPDFALNITTNGKPTQITGVGSTLNTTTVPNTASGDVINPTTNTSSNVLVDLSNPTKPDSAATVRDLQNMGWIVEAEGNGYKDTVKNANRVNFKGDGAVNVTGSTENGVRTITVTTKADGTTITIDPNKGLVANTTNIVANPNGTVSVDPAGNGGNLVNGTTVVNAINSAGHTIKAAKTNNLVTSNNGSAKVNPGKTVTYQAGKNLEANITVNANGDSTVTYGLSDNISVNTVQVGGNTGPIITGDKNGNIVIGKADANGNLAPTQIKNVAPGTADTDAVNVSQLRGVAGNINNRINKVDKDLRAGIAGANAAAGLPQVYLPGKSMVAASAGHFKGENALAVGYSRASDNGKLILKLQGNTNSRGDVGGSVGVGYQW
ncbi:YadA-like family protein [Rodentibacter abscessus]|uniref:YadA-like family protein n=1 Tax=Rodentibacter abscessus TaxID=3381777 RepID=UPI00399D47A9